VSGTGSDNTPAPSAALDHVSVSSGRGVVLSSGDVMPEMGNTSFRDSRRMSYESRISQYRRKRRKERKRKLVFAILFAVVSVVAGLSYLKVHSPQRLENVVHSVGIYYREFMSQSGIRDVIGNSKELELISQHVSDFLDQTGIRDVISQTKEFYFLSKSVEQEVIPQPVEQQVLSTTSESNMTFNYNATNITDEWDASFVKELEQHVCGDDEIRLNEAFDQDKNVESFELLSLPITDLDLQSAVKAAFEVTIEKEHSHIMDRPWACNIPFAYLFHPSCFRLAKQNPVFDLQDLVQHMFQ
jgi:hypothetical protein